MLAEIRIGPGKLKLKGVIANVSRGCKLRKGKIHRVPHLTIYYLKSLSSKQLESIKEKVRELHYKYKNLEYTIDGFKSLKGEKGWVIYFNAIPNRALSGFTRELRLHLRKISPPIKSFDAEDEFVFHITLAYKLNEYEHQQILNYLETPDKWGKKLSDLYMPLTVARFTLLGPTSHILYEYDFYQRRFLNRSESLNRAEWAKTLAAMRINLKSQLEIINRTEKNSIYLMSDLHLGHENIIKYCVRPFVSVNDMNRVLIGNWNNTVGEKDTVYYCGDMTFGRGPGPEYWIKKLNGKINYIRGNHDIDKKYSLHTLGSAKLIYKGYKFLFLHDPVDAPEDFDGWIIHGDKHNNDLKHYPFINGENKTINVCAELINYTPLNLDRLISLRINSIKRMDLLNSEPVRY